MYIELISVCNAKVMNAMDWFIPGHCIRSIGSIFTNQIELLHHRIRIKCISITIVLNRVEPHVVIIAVNNLNNTSIATELSLLVAIPSIKSYQDHNILIAHIID